MARSALGSRYLGAFDGLVQRGTHQPLHRSLPALVAAGHSHQTIELLHHLIRKSAHFTEYFILSLLILRGIRAGGKGLRHRWALATVLIIAGYAALDEFHQSFVPGREPAVTDVLIDTSGGITAQLVASLVDTLGGAASGKIGERNGNSCGIEMTFRRSVA